MTQSIKRKALAAVFGAWAFTAHAAEYEAFFVLVPEPGNTSMSSQSSNGYTLSLVTLGSLEVARHQARELAANGVTAIELSSGFGEEGLAAIREEVGESIKVGLVRYETP